MEMILDYFEQAVGEVPSCMLLPEFDVTLSSLTDNDVTVRYYFKDDSELSFELIQLRDWLIAIGCPMSLVYRITRFFYYVTTLGIIGLNFSVAIDKELSLA